MSEPMMPYEPMPPAADGQQAPAKPKVPWQVNLAFAVWVLTTLVVSVLIVLDSGAYVAEIEKQLASQGQAQQIDPGTLKNFLVGTIVVYALLMLLFAWKMRSGRNWARIVLTVLAVFGLLSQASSSGVQAAALLGVFITAVGLVFMFVPAANAYFAQIRQQLLQRRLRR